MVRQPVLEDLWRWEVADQGILKAQVAAVVVGDQKLLQVSEVRAQNRRGRARSFPVC
jgi:hypothetical protein